MPATVAVPLIASAIGGGATLGAAKMASNSQKNIAAQQQALAQQQLDRSKPAFDKAYGYYGGLLDNPMGAPGINDTSRQFDTAQQNLLANSYTRGGGLSRGYSTIESGRARAISDMLARGRQTGAAGLAGLATGDTSGAANILANSRNAGQNDALLQQQAFGGIGSFLTRLLSTPGLFGSGGGKTTPGTQMGPAYSDLGGPPPAEVNYFPQATWQG